MDLTMMLVLDKLCLMAVLSSSYFDYQMSNDTVNKHFVNRGS